MKKKMNIANKIGVKYAIIVGEDEVKSNIVTIKNLDEGNEKMVVVGNVIDYINK
jgi:histidyl-tRNA synthetase